MKQYNIYIVTNSVNDKVYIGQTTRSVEERWKEHISQCKFGHPFHLYHAMRKYGIDKFKAELLDDSATNSDELNVLEEYYIDAYDSIKHGYNMAKGGHNNVMSEPAIKAHHDAVMRSDEVRAKISNTIKQKIATNGISQEARKHMSEARKQLYNSPKGEAVKAKHRASFNMTDEHKAALSQSHHKKVYCIDESNNIVATFNTVQDASRWWFANGYNSVKDELRLCDMIRLSYKENRYIRGLKWIYQKDKKK